MLIEAHLYTFVLLRDFYWLIRYAIRLHYGDLSFLVFFQRLGKLFLGVLTGSRLLFARQIMFVHLAHNKISQSLAGNATSFISLITIPS